MTHIAPKVGEATKYTVIEARRGDDDKNIYEASMGLRALSYFSHQKDWG